MARYTCPLDVYVELEEDRAEDWLRGLLTYAVIEEQKFEWMTHYAEYSGHVPSEGEVKGWYESLPMAAIVRAKGVAQAALDRYAEEMQSSFAESVRRNVEHSALMGEIRQGRKFWPQFGLSVAGGFASSILFGAFLCVAAFLVLNDRSPIGVGASIAPSPTLKKADKNEQEY